MVYQYGQGFEKDLKSIVELFKKENTIDFDPSFFEEEVKKILKYNTQKIIVSESDGTKIEEFETMKHFVSWFNKWDESYVIQLKGSK